MSSWTALLWRASASGSLAAAPATSTSTLLLLQPFHVRQVAESAGRTLVPDERLPVEEGNLH